MKDAEEIVDEAMALKYAEDKLIVVFGPTPGIVTGATVGMGGNLTFLYRALTPEEMGSRPPILSLERTRVRAAAQDLLEMLNSMGNRATNDMYGLAKAAERYLFKTREGGI